MVLPRLYQGTVEGDHPNPREQLQSQLQLQLTIQTLQL